jgi:hypothetical protein
MEEKKRPSIDFVDFGGEVNSEYFQAYYRSIFAKKKMAEMANNMVTILVEAEEDVPFWYSIFKKNIPDLEFDVTPASRIHKGKNVVLGLKEKADPRLLLCVDSDYDYLIQKCRGENSDLETNPFIFQTYAYSIENYQCLPGRLRKILVEASRCSAPEELFSFDSFLEKYSEAVYQLFLYSLAFKMDEIKNNKNPFTVAEFKKVISLNNLGRINISNNGSFLAKELKRNSNEWLEKECEQEEYKAIEKTKNSIESQLKEHEVEAGNVYLFMQGHTVKDAVFEVIKLLVKRHRTFVKEEFDKISRNLHSLEYPTKTKISEKKEFDSAAHVQKIKKITRGLKEMLKKVDSLELDLESIKIIDDRVEANDEILNIKTELAKIRDKVDSLESASKEKDLKEDKQTMFDRISEYFKVYKIDCKTLLNLNTDYDCFLMKKIEEDIQTYLVELKRG